MNLTTLFTKLENRIINLKYFNHWVIFFSDLFFSACASIAALFFIEIALNLALTNKQYIEIFLLSAGSSAIGSFTIQTYKDVIRHSSFMDAGRIGIASLIKEILLITAVFLLSGTFSINFLLLAGVIDFFFTFFLLISIRIILIFSYRFILKQVTKPDFDKEKLLILDTTDNAINLPGNTLRELEQNYEIAGFIRQGNRHALRANGFSIYSVDSQEEFNRIIHNYHIRALLFPDTHALKQEESGLVQYCEKARVKMLMLPSVQEIKEGRINFRNLPEVRIEDLLEREEININIEEIASFLKNKVVMVTGAAGSIGSELCRLLCTFGLKQLVMYDNAETPMHNIQLELSERFPDIEFNMVMGDIRSRKRFERICKSYLPHVIYHVAAYKHVPMMENNPCESVLTNVLGTRVVADTAIKYGVSKFIMVSTDKAVNPSNVMGASKRIAEMYVQSLGLGIQSGKLIGRTRFITTRFGNVLGSNGSVIPRFREQLAKGGPITVTHPEIIRYFMTIPEACRLVLEASHMGKGNEVFVFDMGQPVKIADLANRMIQLAGMIPDKDIKIEYTGLRPGEKLYEELLMSQENLLPTFNKKIFRARVSEQDYHTLLPEIEDLCKLAESLEIIETVRQMKAIVPEFISQSSVYTHLDGERPFADDKYVKPKLEEFSGN
ncbi:polysaccharide biosynthesis protein [Parabacteroides sp. OttesenSCG-928-G21]|nr:polysaccharide biosynthesis protein [Parabacteroides sp. OttesenSCG-928-G21]